MKPTMKSLLVILTVLFIFSSIGIGYVITGGDVVEVHGQGTNSTGTGNPPTYDISYSSLTPRDPSQYRSPASNFTPPNPVNNNSSGLGLNWSANRNSYPIIFDSRSSVSGTGRFSTYRAMEEKTGVAAKQVSSANYGVASLSSWITLTSDVINNTIDYANISNHTYITIDEVKPTYIISFDNTQFSGVLFRERESYSNNGDLIESKITSGQIAKESRLINGLDNAFFRGDITKNRTIVRGLFNKTMDYSLAANYVGVLSLSSRSGGSNHAEVTQEYVGIMNLSSHQRIQEIFKRINETDSWLNCCHP